MSALQMIFEDLILISVNFGRKTQILAPDTTKIKHDTSVNISTAQHPNDQYSVLLTIDHLVTYDNAEIVNIKVEYVGNFKKVGESSEEELDRFLNINAPAIIFPFVREVISSLSAKAMLGAILLQPVNFIKLYSDKKANSDKGN